MAFDDVAAKQRLLSEQESKQSTLNREIQRRSLSLQTNLNDLVSSYRVKQKRSQDELATLNNDISGTQRKIEEIQKEQNTNHQKVQELQKEQSKIQEKLQKLQEIQSDFQRKLAEQQKRHSGLSTTLSDLLRDQQNDENRLRSRGEAEIAGLQRELQSVERGVGTLRADVTRAMEKQVVRERTANTNSAPDRSGRRINFR